VADRLAAELEGRQIVALRQNLCVEQGLANVEVAATEPVWPGSNSAPFDELGPACRFYGRDAIARSISPFDENGVFAGRTAISLVAAHERKRPVILDNSKRNRAQCLGRRNLRVKVNDCARGGLTVMHDLAVDRIKSWRIATPRQRQGRNQYHKCQEPSNGHPKFILS
jgi:hypothetical protein